MRPRAIAPLLGLALTGALGCSAIAGVSELDEWPCDEPCGDAPSDDATTDSVDARPIDPDTARDTTASSDAPDTAGDGDDDAEASDADETATEAGTDTTVPADAPDTSDPCDGTPATQVGLGGYSIDGTEVTNAQYAAFLATSPSVAAQDAVCAWNASFTPAAAWPAPPSGCRNPVANVDWCDAVAYCKWAGKRLCGHPISGSVPYAGSAFVTAASDAWYNACSSGGVNAYPYPGVYIPKFCVDASYDAKSGTKPVGTVATCRPTLSPFVGVYDLVGNVSEWEDSCDKVTGAGDHCRIRGGDYSDDATKASCGAGENQPRNITSPTIGFRCCSK